MVFSFLHVMKWYRAKEFLPDDKEEVIIRVRGIFYLVTFQGDKRRFEVRGQTSHFEVSEEVLWARIISPER